MARHDGQKAEALALAAHAALTGSGVHGATAAGAALLGGADAGAQRTSLGLGDAATLDVGTGAGTVAAGDDGRFSGTAWPVDLTETFAGAAAPTGWSELNAGTGSIDWTTDGEVTVSLASGSSGNAFSGTAPSVVYPVPSTASLALVAHLDHGSDDDNRWVAAGMVDAGDLGKGAVIQLVQVAAGNYLSLRADNAEITTQALSDSNETECWVLVYADRGRWWGAYYEGGIGTIPTIDDWTALNVGSGAATQNAPSYDLQAIVACGNFSTTPAVDGTCDYLRVITAAGYE